MSMRTVAQLSDLSGRAALVTGGAGHVGLAACDALLELGASVGILDLDASACEQRVAELRRRYPKASLLGVPCDLRDEGAIRRAVKMTIKELHGLTIVVHSAAYVGTMKLPGWSAPFEEQTVAAWDEAMRVNVTSAFVIVQEAQQALAASGHGSVVLLSSIYGLVGPDLSLYEGTPMTHAGAYDASKGGLNQLARYLATVLAPRIRVNTISPGGIWRNQPEPFHQRYQARTPLGRMATEEDLKGAVAYLASDLSAYVTGHNLLVDGGWTAW